MSARITSERRARAMSTVRRVALLVVLWLLAWGEVTIANLVTGVVVACALLVGFPPDRRPGHVRLRPLGALRLGGYVLGQLVASNIVMTRQILRPRPGLHPGVLAHRMQQPSEEVVTVMTSVLALSPGTMTVDVDPDSTTIYVHFLFLWDEEAARESLARLDRLCTGVFAPGSSPGAGLTHPNTPKEQR